MSKPNAYLLKLQEERKQQMAYQRLFTLQQCDDMMSIVAHEHLHFGPKRVAEFRAAFYKLFCEYSEHALEDAKDDPDIEYTRELVDRNLREALGDDFEPWDIRYNRANVCISEHLKSKKLQEKIKEDKQ